MTVGARTVSVRVENQIVWWATVGLTVGPGRSSGGEADSLTNRVEHPVVAEAADPKGPRTVERSADYESFPSVLSQIGALLGLSVNGWPQQESSITISLREHSSNGWSLRTLGVHDAVQTITSSSRPERAMSLAVRGTSVWRVAKQEGDYLTLESLRPRDVWAQILDMTA
jgi:hypothetical protein